MFWRFVLSDDIGGALRPKQPVPRGFHHFRLEMGDLAIDERLDHGGPEREELGIGDDGAAAEVVEVAQAEFQIMPKRLCVHALEMSAGFIYGVLTRR